MDRRHTLGNLIKILLSAAIIGFIFYKFPMDSVWDTILSANIGLLLAALAFQILSQTVAAYRWSLIMGILKFDHPFSFYFRSYFKGSLFNQMLPTSVGGDAYRIAELTAHGGLVQEAFYGVFIDRIVGLFGLLLLNLLANLIESDLLPEEVFWSINIVILLAISGLIVLLLIRKVHLLQRYKVTRFFFFLSERSRLIYRTPKRINQQIGLSILIHLLSMIAIFGIGHSVGINEPLVTYLVLIPPAILLTILPISFAGWGVREGALVALFLLIGVDQTQVLAMSLLYGVILILSALPGLYFYLKSKHKYL
ncbi:MULTISPECIES: lysylphosphatidylglycerol synthase transmembrane domain-containing protein [Thiomicrorhabdus]|uniref:lysylphosphatidylglycerol synthase transmembrane domain-containing protein n=1 Tax=Thiomicrorhabdus TaxID=2039723 RepID=UPI001E2A0899|nr:MULTISPECIES: lysylphosphatidylglycerol synthase transmembrane domain-containing protein [Thiomicrorhabdus]